MVKSNKSNKSAKPALALVPAPMAETSVAIENPIARKMTDGKVSATEAQFLAADAKLKGNNPLVGKLASFVPLVSLFLIGDANPRKFFGDVESLATQVQLEGQKTPIVVGTVSGEAAAYLARMNGDGFETSGKKFVFQGARRTLALRSLVSQGIERFSNALAFDVGDISDRATLEKLITDDVGRVNPELRCEVAQEVASYIEAGWTKEAVAAIYGKSTGWVQSMEDVACLPDTPTFPCRSKVREYDVEQLSVAKKLPGFDRDNPKSLNLDTATVKELALSWRLHNGGKPHGRMKNPPKPFPELWAEIVANGTNRPKSAPTSVSHSDVNDAATKLATRIDETDPVLIALRLFRDALLAPDVRADGKLSRSDYLARIHGANPPKTLPDVAKPFAPLTPIEKPSNKGGKK